MRNPRLRHSMRILSCFVALLLSMTAVAQSVIPNNPGKKGTFAIRNATIYPVTSAPIANGTIVFSNGVITAIGASVSVPSGATVIDGTGLSVYPGLIDSGTNIGLSEIDSVAGTVDTTELGDFNPNARAAVAINPHSEAIPVTRVNGITNVVVNPEGGIISGESAFVQLAGWTPKEMTVRDHAGMNLRFPRLRSGGFGDQRRTRKRRRSGRRRTRRTSIVSAICFAMRRPTRRPRPREQRIRRSSASIAISFSRPSCRSSRDASR